MNRPHALVLPFPAQGHVIPLLELSYSLADHGFSVTFVPTDFDHRRLLAAMSTTNTTGAIRLVSIPDGLPADADRNDLGQLCEAMLEHMPGYLEELIKNATESDGAGEFTCLIADQNMAWAFDVAKRMNLGSIVFWPASAAILALFLSFPKLIEDGVIDEDGMIKKPGMVNLLPEMPPMDTAHFTWKTFGDSQTQRFIFHFIANNNRAMEGIQFILCNSFYELERPVFAHAPRILPIGPLVTGRREGKAVGRYWQEDATCMAWLDDQPASSVVYVAFGSFTIFDRKQFRELALGLEISGRRFLWVVRPDFKEKDGDAFPEGFKDRIQGQGKMVDWAPQQSVLAHPAIACFMSHCGWNSTLEGVMNGVSFLCWPYFVDQHFNQRYICDVWRTGLKLIPDENNLVTKEQIKEKVEELLGDEGMRSRALAFKEMAWKSITEGGSSFENFNEFVSAMKQEQKL